MTIPLTLNPDQAGAIRSGSDQIELTEEQALSVRGKLTSASRRASCDCGQCKKCYNREAKRKERAKS